MKTFEMPMPEGWQVGPVPIPEPGTLDAQGIVESFSNQMTYSVMKDEHTATLDDVYRALALSVRNRLAERWFRTQEMYYWLDLKRVYYLSLEFLTGRALLNNILNLGARNEFTEAMGSLGYRMEQIEERELDAGLGNGGLGRLAACFLESAATLGIPFHGYGIRYEYGIFRQEIVDGAQVEAPDNWLRYGNPWEVPRPNVVYPVRFFGRVEFKRHGDGSYTADWLDGETIQAMAYDTLVAGYRNDVVNSLRLWAAKATQEFDLASFNAGDYVRAVERKNATENISKVLYPPDDQSAGKELRLKQQYFFVSATLQNVLRRYRKTHDTWDKLTDKVAIQLNDTHPSIAVPEMMRLLIDENGLAWEDAWQITEKLFAFTNHTVLPEALESWPSALMGRLLPRHVQIIEEIDRRLRRRVSERYPGDEDKVRRMAIVDDANGGVRMTNLAIAGSHAVNGVAALHSHLLRDRLFPDFNEFYPGKFRNVTNGVTPRRWLEHANPPLTRLITEAVGDGWPKDLQQVSGIERFASDAGFREKWAAAKRENKQTFAMWCQARYGIAFDPDWILDCQVKRIHEYKRQLLNLMHAIALYRRINSGIEIIPRTVLFAGKAAPSYFMAKCIISLANAVGQMIETDPRAQKRLRVIFVPNYSVSHAEKIFPATEISEQISTAGTEASGTGNMKAVLNGALIVGTLDGANIEIREAVGAENIFIFGNTIEVIEQLRREGTDPWRWISASEELRGVVETIQTLSRQYNGRFDPIVEILTRRDAYFHCADFVSYMATQDEAARTWTQQDLWTTRSIVSVARSAPFSSDRTIHEYASQIWNAQTLDDALAKLKKTP